MMEKSVVNIPMKMPDFILEIWGIHLKFCLPQCSEHPPKNQKDVKDQTPYTTQ